MEFFSKKRGSQNNLLYSAVITLIIKGIGNYEKQNLYC